MRRTTLIKDFANVSFIDVKPETNNFKTAMLEMELSCGNNLHEEAVINATGKKFRTLEELYAVPEVVSTNKEVRTSKSTRMLTRKAKESIETAEK